MTRLTPVLLVLAACGHDVALGGPNTLVRVDNEPPGANCEQGGLAVHSGLDNDGDTYLDDEEFTSTQYVCNGISPVQCGGGVVVTGTISVHDAADVSDLADANCIDGDLLITGLEAASFALPNLEIVTGDIVIAGNQDLASLAGFSALRSVGRRITIQGNDALADLGTLGTLERADAISIVGNDSLVDLRGLEGLTDIAMSLTIMNNGGLTSLAGLENVTSSQESIKIRTNRSLDDITALDSLRSIVLLDISGNNALAGLRLESLEKVDVRLIIDDNSTMTTAVLPKLATVGEFISFDGDPALRSIDAPALLTVSSFFVRNDTTITRVSAPALVFATTNIELANTPALTSVDFGSLIAIGNAFLVKQCNALANLDGFVQLQSIGGSMTITQNTGFTNFAGLSRLESVSGTLAITDNPNIANFNGLGAFTEVGSDLTITNNASLPEPAAQAFANRITVRGTVTIN